MFRIIHHLVGYLRGGFFQLSLFVGLVLLLWGTVAPVGTLVWWLNQGQKGLEWKRRQTAQSSINDRPSSSKATAHCYIIYLPGVGDASANQLTAGEEWFLNRLVEQHPDCVSVRDIFPYSAANKDLVGERLLAPLWQAAEQADGWLKEADILIKIRNLWRFAISADDRYGPVYSQGIAEAMIDRMDAVSSIPEANPESLKIILIGTSGGVQVALGAAPYLNDWLNNPQLYVISAGGDFDGEAGFDAIDRMYHLQGDRDWVEDLSAILFPARWRWTIGSPFNRARHQDRFIAIHSGPHTHDGRTGYFGLATVNSQQTTYAALTLQLVNQLPIFDRHGSFNSHRLHH